MAGLATAAGAAACSVDTEGTGDPAPTGGDDAGGDVTTGGPDGAVTDDGGGGDTALPPVDAGPDTATTNCKAANCALSIAAGPAHTCAILGDRTVKCWGDNIHGELGSGTQDGGNVSPQMNATPMLVSGIAGATSISLGGTLGIKAFSCALVGGGSVRCWGANDLGQLGAKTDAAVSVDAVTVGADAAATQIDVGLRHGCMVDSAGALRCWGLNFFGERGNPELSAWPSRPTRVGLDLRRARNNLRASDGRQSDLHGCQRQRRGSAEEATLEPLDQASVDAGGLVEDISASVTFTCATLTGNVTSCWGSTGNSRLGRGAAAGATAQPGSPLFSPGFDPTRVATGGAHACAIMTDRGVSCWGSNTRGQAGDFSGKDPVTTPSGVGGLGKVVQLALGGGHSCALTEDGDVYCWGVNNRGQLALPSPDGSVDNASHPDPVKVPL
ncbi:MAG: hypothetical protein IPG50_07685 [Myxococcales bacterium]|nr:hypothetical protein [Myxococcales bacterium]